MRGRLAFITAIALIAASRPNATLAAELPAHYFRLLEAELKALEPNDLSSNPGAMLAASVLYAKQHAANRSFGDTSKRELALRLGDLLCSQCEADRNPTAAEGPP